MTRALVKTLVGSLCMTSCSEAWGGCGVVSSGDDEDTAAVSENYDRGNLVGTITTRWQY